VRGRVELAAALHELVDRAIVPPDRSRTCRRTRLDLRIIDTTAHTATLRALIV